MKLSRMLFLFCFTAACAGGSETKQSSEPINNSEQVEYRQALVRCYKSGGNRVVKIMGQLRCF